MNRIFRKKILVLFLAIVGVLVFASIQILQSKYVANQLELVIRSQLPKEMRFSFSNLDIDFLRLGIVIKDIKLEQLNKVYITASSVNLHLGINTFFSKKVKLRKLIISGGLLKLNIDKEQNKNTLSPFEEYDQIAKEIKKYTSIIVLENIDLILNEFSTFVAKVNLDLEDSNLSFDILNFKNKGNN